MLRRAAVAAVGLVAVTAIARAERHPTVSVEVDPCADVDGTVVRRLVAIELGTPLAEAPAPEVTRLAAHCEGALVALTVDDPITGKTLARRIDLRIDPASARARLLALAAVELVVASWIELQAPAAVARPVDAVAAPDVRLGAAAIVASRTASSPSPVTLEVQGAIRVYEGPSVSYGGGLAALWRLPAPWVLGADLLVETQSSQTVIGDTRTWRLTAAPRVGAVFLVGGLELEGDVGFRIGAAYLSGSAQQGSIPVQAHSFFAPWGGPLLAIGARTGRTLSLGFTAEVGVTVFSVEGEVNGEAATRLAGPWLLLSLLVGIPI